MKNIYVTVSRSNTASAGAFRCLTGHGYDHVSVGFSERPSVMYSFAKKKMNVPLEGGFVAEYPSRYFAGGGDVPVRVYAVPFEDEEYMRVRDVIRSMMSHPQIYTYNIFDKAASVFGASFEIKRSYTDLSFVCRLLGLGKIKSIKELEFVLQPYLCYDGTLNELVSDGDGLHGAEYFNYVTAGKAFLSSALYGLKLIGKKIYENI